MNLITIIRNMNIIEQALETTTNNAEWKRLYSLHNKLESWYDEVKQVKQLKEKEMNNEQHLGFTDLHDKSVQELVQFGNSLIALNVVRCSFLSPLIV